MRKKITKNCARPGCKVTFKEIKRGSHDKRYCSRICAGLCRSTEARYLAAEKTREKKARNKAEARAMGVHPDQVLDMKLERYWKTVADPEYYTEIRGYGFRSALEDI